MTAATYDAAMVRVFADEGGYTNDPVDPGGATNWGITIIDARKYWKANATPADVKAMPKAVASNIYLERYAKPIRYNDLPAGYDYSVIDAEINSGFGRVVPWSAKALGKPVKSVDDVVRESNAAPDKVALIQKFWAVRLAFLKGLSTFWRFGKGWTRRVTTGEAAAVKMWLTFGAGLPASETKKRLDAESATAKKQSTAATTAATASGTVGGGAAASPATPIDTFALSTEAQILIFAVAAIGLMLAIYFIKQAMIHKQRADAYAAA